MAKMCNNGQNWNLDYATWAQTMAIVELCIAPQKHTEKLVKSEQSTVVGALIATTIHKLQLS